MDTELQEKRSLREPSKKERMLANPDVKRWYDNVARGSINTAESNMRKLSKFCEDHQITPNQLADLGRRDVKAVTDLLEDHINWMEEQGKAPQSINGMIKAIKSWLRHNEVEIRRRLKIRNVDSTPTLENEKIPDGKELSELFDRANLRAGAMIALINKAGLRPEVLGNHSATEGLAIKDLPDLAIVQGLATFARNPPRIIVRRSLNKVGHEYFTFITPLGAKKLIAYLNDRIMHGESLGPDSPVIAPSKKSWHRGKNEGNKFVSTITVRKEIRRAMRPRFNWRPYVHRRYFDTQLLIAESRGKVAHDFRVFWMGHKGSIEAVYTTNKGIVSPQLVNEMREAFKRSTELLDLEASQENEVEKQKEQLKEKIENLTPEMLAKVQELLNGSGNAGASRESSEPMMQKSSSTRVGSMPELYQTEKSSSKDRYRYQNDSGPVGH